MSKKNFKQRFERAVDNVSVYDILDHFDVSHNPNSLKTLCPVHNESTPSMVVYEKTKTWKCFGCGAGGDVTTLVKYLLPAKTQGEALSYIEEQFGLVKTKDVNKLRERLKNQKRKKSGLRDRNDVKKRSTNEFILKFASDVLYNVRQWVYALPEEEEKFGWNTFDEVEKLISWLEDLPREELPVYDVCKFVAVRVVELKDMATSFKEAG